MVVEEEDEDEGRLRNDCCSGRAAVEEDEGATAER